jgi:hypothetical protein
MGRCIGKKKLVSQLGAFEKFRVLVVVVVPTKARFKFMMKCNGKE